MIQNLSKKQKLCAKIALIIIVISLLCSYIIDITYCADTYNRFDDVNVLDDLQSSQLGGDKFDINNYPADETQDARLINVVEYCYSYYTNMQGNYGLYFYVYNPKCLDFDAFNFGNKIQMAVAWDDDGAPTDYDTFDIKYLSRSSGNGVNNLFYKFKLVDRVGKDGKRVVDRVARDERRYDISGIRLVAQGAVNAREYTVGGTYKFSGFVAGYGADPNAVDTSKCSVTDKETITLDVDTTTFRTGASAAGKKHQNQLNSVYFAVPNAVMQAYDKLQKIKSEWYEYKTAPILITELAELYNAYLPYLGKNIGTGDKNNNLKYGVGVKTSRTGVMPVTYDWSYNISTFTSPTASVISKNKCGQLSYLFNTDNVRLADYELPSKKLSDYIYNYNKSANNGYLSIKNGKISKDLFLDKVDDGRTMGYNDSLIDTDAKFDLLSYDSANSGWDKFWDYFGRWGVETGGDYYGVEPIKIIKDYDVSAGDEAISKSLLINKSDVTAFKDRFNEAVKNDCTLVLFRFAKTDYYAALLSTWEDAKMNDKSFIAQETVFLDYKIIYLDFSKDGKSFIVPVVQNPIDIIPSVTPPLDSPKDSLNWLWIILGIIALILLMPILAPLIGALLKLVFWIIPLPFRLIGSIFRVGKNKTRGAPTGGNYTTTGLKVNNTNIAKDKAKSRFKKE